VEPAAKHTMTVAAQEELHHSMGKKDGKEVTNQAVSTMNESMATFVMNDWGRVRW
jgi:hypothetical protein